MSTHRPQLSILKILIYGGLMVTLSMGIRHGFGLFNLPITQANHWGRETFGLAIALQNLVWGLSQPVFGGLADRFGGFRVMLIGGVLYSLGLLGMAYAASPSNFILVVGLVIGFAQACTTYSIVYGVIGRNCPPEKRIWAMGITAAMGSFGQFLMIPTEQGLINFFGTQEALLISAFMASFMIPLALQLREPVSSTRTDSSEQSIREAIFEAFTQKSFCLLMVGYFVCGFQVVFIAVHLAPYLKDMASIQPTVGAPEVATIALALVGLFNIFGTYYSGILGQKYPKRYLLSAIYGLRSVVIAVFIYLPITPTSTYIFASLMGLLWLSTIPLTNGVVAHIFGVKYLSMLSGFVFMAHQMGSFCGSYLGGYLFDITGSYDIVWTIAIGLGVLAFLINLPIKELPLERSALGPQKA